MLSIREMILLKAEKPWNAEIADILTYIDSYVVMQEITDNPLVIAHSTKASAMEQIHAIKIYYISHANSTRAITIFAHENRKATGRMEIQISSLVRPTEMAKIFRRMYIMTYHHIPAGKGWDYTISFSSLQQLGKLISMFEKGEI